jgi:hypothetical protein
MGRSLDAQLSYVVAPTRTAQMESSGLRLQGTGWAHLVMHEATLCGRRRWPNGKARRQS